MASSTFLQVPNPRHPHHHHTGSPRHSPLRPDRQASPTSIHPSISTLSSRSMTLDRSLGSLSHASSSRQLSLDSGSRSSLPHPSNLHLHPHNQKLSRLRNFLTPNKHATFLVKLTIHEVNNIPLVTGRFSVAWKFRGGKGSHELKAKTSQPRLRPTPTATPSPRSLLARSLSSESAKASVPPPQSQNQNSSSSSRTDPSSISSHGVGSTSSTGTSSISATPAASSPLVNDGLTEEPAPLIENETVSSPTSLGPADIQNEEDPESHSSSERASTEAATEDNPSRTSSINTAFGKSKSKRNHSKSKSRSADDAALGLDQDTEREIQFPSASSFHRKGRTSIKLLDDHRVEWKHHLAQLVKMNINAVSYTSSTHSGRSTPTRALIDRTLEEDERTGIPGRLGSGPHSESGLKLIVYQHPAKDQEEDKVQMDGEPSRDHHYHTATGNVFGVVELDLAEYASEEANMGHGGITRRYLLKKGKTNATIKLTIELEQVSGERNFETPPLQRGHVVAGLTELGGEDAIQQRMARLNPGSSASASSVSANASPDRSSSHLAGGASSTSLASERSRRPPEAHFVQPVTTYMTDIRNANNIYDPEFVSNTRDRKGQHTRSHLQPQHQHSQQQQHHHHLHLLHGSGTPKRESSPSSMNAERIIEAIFNPMYSTEETPFTRKYPRGVHPAMETDDDGLSVLENQATPPATSLDRSQESLGSGVSDTSSAPSSGAGALRSGRGGDLSVGGSRKDPSKQHRVASKLKHVMGIP